MPRISAKFITVLPLTNNEGVDHTSLVEQIERDICILTGGVTIQEVSGIWYEDGVRYTDRSHKVETAVIADNVREVASKLDNLKNLARSWGRLLQQIAMYTEIVWSDIEILDSEVDCILDYDLDAEIEKLIS